MRFTLKPFGLKALSGVQTILVIVGITLFVVAMILILGVGFVFLACWPTFVPFLLPTIAVVGTIFSYAFAKVLKGFFYPKVKEKEEEQEAAPILPRAYTVGRIFKNGIKGPQSQMAHHLVRGLKQFKH